MVAAAAGAGRRAQFGLGVLRLLRLRRIFDVLALLEADVTLPYAAVRGVRFLAIILLQCHVFACIFFLVAVTESPLLEHTWIMVHAKIKPDGLPSRPLQRYLFSLYWAVVTLASVGYGDITPVTDAEYLVAIVYMISNIGLIAYVVGNMTVLAVAADQQTHAFRAAFQNLEAYVGVHQLPEDVRAEMRSYMQLRFKSAEDHREVMDSFPPVLLARVSRLLHLPVLAASPLLTGLGSAFVDLLACHVTIELFMPGVTVVSQFDASMELFFLASGTAEVLALDEAEDKQPAESLTDSATGAELVLLETIGRGASFGEVPFLFHLPQPFMVRSPLPVLCCQRLMCCSGPHGDALPRALLATRGLDAC